jgi:hypothetical protein
MKKHSKIIIKFPKIKISRRSFKVKSIIIQEFQTFFAWKEDINMQKATPEDLINANKNFKLSSNHFDHIDEDNKYVNFQNIDWSITLCLTIEKNDPEKLNYGLYNLPLPIENKNNLENNKLLTQDEKELKLLES